MKKFRLVDNILGWLTFAIAAFVYCSTIEPTASFWDCPEFISTGYKLEIGHPPGAPFFMLTANLFSQFASDPSHHPLPVLDHLPPCQAPAHQELERANHCQDDSH